MKKRKKPILTMLLCFWVALLVAQTPKASYKVIVHRDNPEVSLQKSLISKYFYKTSTKWSNGDHVLPVDKTRDDAVRERFSDEVHQKRARAVEAYWRKQIFSGRGIPPAQFEEDARIAQYVSENPAAIGYIADDFDISQYHVKEISVLDD